MKRQALAAIVIVLLMAGCFCTVRAQTSSKQRDAAFAKLPDWSGIWELDAFVGQSDGQQFSAEGQRELKAYAAAMRPSFTPEYQAKYDAIRKKVADAVAAAPAPPPPTPNPRGVGPAVTKNT